VIQPGKIGMDENLTPVLIGAEAQDVVRCGHGMLRGRTSK
jgi:hypothetical protein